MSSSNFPITPLRQFSPPRPINAQRFISFKSTSTSDLATVPPTTSSHSFSQVQPIDAPRFSFFKSNTPRDTPRFLCSLSKERDCPRDEGRFSATENERSRDDSTDQHTHRQHHKISNTHNTHCREERAPHVEHLVRPHLNQSIHPKKEITPHHRVWTARVTIPHTAHRTPPSRQGFSHRNPKVFTRTSIQGKSGCTFHRSHQFHASRNHMGRPSCALGRTQTANSLSGGGMQLHIYGIHDHHFRVWNRPDNLTSHSSLHQSNPETLRRPQIQNNHPDHVRADHRSYSLTSHTSQCDNTHRVEESRKSQRRSRDERGWIMVGTGGHTDSRRKEESSDVRGTLRQGVLGRAERSHTDFDRRHTPPTPHTLSLTESTRDPTPNETITLAAHHNRKDHQNDSETTSRPLIEEYPERCSSNTDSERLHFRELSTSLTPPHTRWVDEIPRNNRLTHLSNPPQDAGIIVKRVKIHPTIQMVPFDSSQKVSSLLSSLKQARGKVCFSPFHSVHVSFDTPIRKPHSHHHRKKKESHHHHHHHHHHKERERPLEKQRDKNDNFLFPPHPPKIPKIFFDIMSFLRYDISPEFVAYSSLPQEPRRSIARALSSPLKEISSSIINFPFVQKLAENISHTVSTEYSSLISIISNVEKFCSLFISPSDPPPTAKKSALTPQDLQNLKEWSTVTSIPRDSPPIYSNFAFKVLKSDNSTTRLILDCKELNKRMKEPPTFHLPQPISIICIILSSNFAVVADFRSWFFQHQICKEIAFLYFAFRVGGKWNALGRLAQGWKFSPSIAQKTSEILSFDPLSQDNDLRLTWIDNLFFGSRTVEDAQQKRMRFISRCDDARAEIGEISEIVTSFEYVGGEFDLIRKRWRVKDSWVRRALPLLDQFPPKTSLRRVWCVMGILLWFLRLTLLPLTLADPLIFFLSRLAKQVSTNTLDWTDTVEVWPSVLENIQSLKHTFHLNSWRTLSSPLPFPSPNQLPLAFSDASLVGGAGVYDGRVIWRSSWEHTQSQHDIFLLETRAWRETVRWMLDHNITSFVTVTDNQALYYSLIKTRSKNYQVNTILLDVLMMLREKRALIYAGWIDTESMPADAASRGVTERITTPNVNQIHFSQYPVVCSSDEH